MRSKVLQGDDITLWRGSEVILISYHIIFPLHFGLPAHAEYPSSRLPSFLSGRGTPGPNRHAWEVLWPGTKRVHSHLRKKSRWKSWTPILRYLPSNGVDRRFTYVPSLSVWRGGNVSEPTINHSLNAQGAAELFIIELARRSLCRSRCPRPDSFIHKPLSSISIEDAYEYLDFFGKKFVKKDLYSFSMPIVFSPDTWLGLV